MNDEDHEVVHIYFAFTRFFKSEFRIITFFLFVEFPLNVCSSLNFLFAEYVASVVDFILTKSMKPQFDAFKLGFLRVCQQRPLQVLHV